MLTIVLLHGAFAASSWSEVVEALQNLRSTD